MQNSRTRETDEEEKRGLRGGRRNSALPTGTFGAGGSLTRSVPPRWLVVSRTLATFAFLGARYTPPLTKRRDRVSRNTSAFCEEEIIRIVKGVKHRS